VKILSVVGARPQFVKLGPMHRAITKAGLSHLIVHTGQHYDDEMSSVFFSELDIPKPNLNLGVGSGPHGQQTARMIESLEKKFLEYKPNWIVIYGDTNSTLAAAIAATKINIPIAHVEAGLRSFNRAMPEEINRIVADHCSDLLLAPTAAAMTQLSNEGLSSKSELVGDVMVDSLNYILESLKKRPVDLKEQFDLPNKFLLATIHRAENTDSKERIESIIDALSKCTTPIIIPVHPRLGDRCSSFNINLNTGNLRSIRPLSYRELVHAAKSSEAIITDSGGLQKEAFLLAKPCTTIRSETEWVETLENDWNVLLPDLTDLSEVSLREVPKEKQPQPFGDGSASEKIVEILTKNK
jgi:UDP-N-acetylglucosamine 2-epimerase (non-hydrolysing)